METGLGIQDRYRIIFHNKGEEYGRVNAGIKENP
jgi:hypothetical protein